MGDRVAAIATAYNPELRATAPQQGTEVVGINQNPAVHRQVNHLLWGGGGIELTPQLGIAIQEIQEVIQGIQQRG